MKQRRHVGWSWFSRALTAINAFHFYALIASITSTAVLSAGLVDFNPINGTFQNFNPIARLQQGQAMFTDFACYLGLGPTTLMRVASGPNALYSDTVLGALLCASASLFFICLLLGIFSRLPVWAAILAAASAVGSHWGFVQLPFDSFWVKYTILWLCDGANSALALRASYPFILAAILYVLYRDKEIRIGRRNQLQVAAMGAFLACGLVWSNDYGCASLASFFATQMLFYQSTSGTVKGNLQPLLNDCAILLVSFAIVLLSLLYIVTAGHPYSWYHYNFLSVARDQYWYFEGDPILFWSEITLKPHVAAGVVVLFAHCGIVRFCGDVKKTSNREFLLVYVSLACLLAGLTSQVGGHLDDRYFAPFSVCSVYLLWSLVAQIIRMSPLAKIEMLIYRHTLASTLIRPLGVSAMFAFIFGGTTVSYLEFRPVAAPDGSRVQVEELGGAFSSVMDSLVAWGQKIKQDTAGLPPQSRLFSTYATALEIIAGARSPARADYIIHALGTKERHRYIEDFRTARTPFAATVRADKISWEPWIRRANWPFYRALLGNYEPVDTTHHHIIWRMKPKGIIKPEFEFSCEVERLRDSAVTITTQALGNHQSPGHTRIAEIEVSYRLGWAPPRPIRMFEGPGRRLVRAHDFLQREPGGDISVEMRGFSLPPIDNTYSFPIEPGPSGVHSFVLEAYPLGRVTLNVDSCRVIDVCRKEVVDDFKPQFINAAAVSDGLYTNGIVLDDDRSHILVSDKTRLNHLGVGDVLQFSSGQILKIVQVAENIISVDGILSAQLDGFPHMVEVLDASSGTPGKASLSIVSGDSCGNERTANGILHEH